MLLGVGFGNLRSSARLSRSISKGVPAKAPEPKGQAFVLVYTPCSLSKSDNSDQA